MDLRVELREGLHKMIDQTKDVSILQAVYVILEREKQHEQGEEDFYDALHPLLKTSIEKGLEEIKNGQTVPHEEVKKRYDKWLK